MARRRQGSLQRTLFARGNIALVVSIAALVLAYLGYRASTTVPDLFVWGSVMTAGEQVDGEQPLLCRIYVQNTGSAVASDLTVSISELEGHASRVVLSPPRQFDLSTQQGVVHLRVAALGAGDRLTVSVETSAHAIPPPARRHSVGPPYFVHVSCKEGSDASTFVGLGVDDATTGPAD